MLLRERDASVLDQPSLEWYRKAAKRLLRAGRAGDAAALARLGEALGTLPEPLRLADVQRALAREHGYGAWPTFRRAVLEAEGASVRSVSRIGIDDVEVYEATARGLAAAVGRADPLALKRVRTHVTPASPVLSDTTLAARPLAGADARLVVAREYGFPTWQALADGVGAVRQRVEHWPGWQGQTGRPMGEAIEAIRRGDPDALRALLEGPTQDWPTPRRCATRPCSARSPSPTPSAATCAPSSASMSAACRCSSTPAPTSTCRCRSRRASTGSSWWASSWQRAAGPAPGTCGASRRSRRRSTTAHARPPTSWRRTRRSSRRRSGSTPGSAGSTCSRGPSTRAAASARRPGGSARTWPTSAGTRTPSRRTTRPRCSPRGSPTPPATGATRPSTGSSSTARTSTPGRSRASRRCTWRCSRPTGGWSSCCSPAAPTGCAATASTSGLPAGWIEHVRGAEPIRALLT